MKTTVCRWVVEVQDERGTRRREGDTIEGLDRAIAEFAPPTCETCAHAARCAQLLGPSFSPKSTTCDWIPSRWTPRGEGTKG